MEPIHISPQFGMLDLGGGDDESDSTGSTSGGSYRTGSLSSSFSETDVDDEDVRNAAGNQTVIAPQVVVIGAGISGLRAASILKANGIQVTVLEARDRIGGRILTSRAGAKPRELGAAWAHETSQNQLVPLIPKLGIDYYFDDGTPLYYTPNGLAGSQFKAKKVADEFADFCEYWYEKHPDAEDKPGQAFIKEYVARHPLLSDEEKKWAPEAFRECELWQGISTDVSSTRYLSYFITERNAYVTGGYDKLTNHYAKPLLDDIKLNEKVTKIVDNEADGTVTIHCENSEDSQNTSVFTADAVVVTVPLGVLKRNMIKFEPSLGPLYETSLEKYSYAALGKVFFEFEQVFWSKDNDQMIYYPDSSTQTGVLANAFVINNLYVVIGAKELCIQTAYPLTAEIEKMTSDQVLEYFKPLLELIRTDQSKPLPRCNSVETTKWTQDKYAGYGTYSAVVAGDDPYMFLHYLDANKTSRIQFAGEHCTMIGNGCVHGAFGTGELAASNLMRHALECWSDDSSITSVDEDPETDDFWSFMSDSDN